jgi:hypothetical protein
LVALLPRRLQLFLILFVLVVFILIVYLVQSVNCLLSFLN